jgi:hypothetical protein
VAAQQSLYGPAGAKQWRLDNAEYIHSRGRLALRRIRLMPQGYDCACNGGVPRQVSQVVRSDGPVVALVWRSLIAAGR